MPQIQYPFIDIAVHPAVRTRFAAGEAIALFSRDMTQVLWANGEGARLFGYSDIYDLLDNGPDRSGVAFRQLSATARQLETIGDRRSLMMRITAGFISQAVPAEVSLVEVRRGETVVIFSAAVAANAAPSARIAAMLKGFDDPDTHMAVVDDQGAVLAASPGFESLGVLPETTRGLIAAVAKSGEGLIKRPIASAAGYLPAAIGRLSFEPPLNLLFCVETVLGRMDPPQEIIETPNATAEAPALAVVSTDNVEKEVSLPGIDEDDDLPVEGMVETFELAETDARPTPAHTDTPLPFAAEPSRDIAELPVTADTETEPHNIELASDKADVASEADVAEPEEHAEAEMAEATLNEGESSDDIEDLANLDGASPDDIASHSGAEQQELAEFEQPTEAANAPVTELSADQAKAMVSERDDNAAEPEEHAEAALNADVNTVQAMPADDAAAALLQDDTSAEQIVGHVADESESASTTEAENTVEPEAHAQPESGEPENITDEQHLGASDGVQSADIETQAFVANSEDMSVPAVESDLQQPVSTDTVVEPPTEANIDPVPTADTPEVTASASPEATADTMPEIASEAAIGTETTCAESEFRFRREGRPVRFVWKLDAQGRFSEVSDEFARTVGPHAGDINGMSYRDLDSLFNLDPNNEISALLERRDTWSGRTIRWPVEGTDLVVPVDLAALPTYSRNREFDGFRGFGIIRVTDAERDPNATGLTLGQSGTQPATTEQVDTTPDTDDVPLTVDGQFDTLHADNPTVEDPIVSFSNTQTISAEDIPLEPVDEFQGEVPALKLESNPLAGFSEKIIQLEERRSRAREGLSPSEQNAFREIARQLEPFGKRPNESLLAGKDDHAEIEALLSGDAVGDTRTPESTGTTDVASETEAGSVPEVSHDDSILEAAPDNNGDTPADADVDSNAIPEDEQSDGPGLTAAAADQIPIAILIHAGDRLIHANGEFKRFSGYDSLEALKAAGGLDALITRKEGPDAGVYMIRADGAHVPVAARLQSVRYEGAKLLMLTLTQADAAPAPEVSVVEDQAAARKLSALQVEAEELRSILETATDGVVVLDTDGRIRSMNRSASALFNFEDSETRGKPFAMLFAHESQKAVQDYLNGLMGHGVASVLNDGREVIGREASGGFIPLFMTMGRMPGSNSYCAVIRDITQWKRSEEELRAAKRAAETANQHKSDFLARVSHEIRTPLNAIIGFSDMIASEHFGPAGHARYVEYANDIGRSGRHVLDIVNDLLDISKIEAGEMDLEFAAVGINDCISEAVTLVQPQANSQRVIIRTSLSQSVPDVVADLRSIKQIAINILANAIRFTPSGGQIVVSTAYESTGSVALRIRDTGVGMSKADLEQAMKPFGQVSPGTRHRGDGTGLGLPLTKAMTEANRALFSIQSSPNEGTLVEIIFPPQRVLAD